MKLQVKSNGREVEMKKDLYEGLTEDQRRSYVIISKEDAPEKPEQKVDNQMKSEKKPPENGEKK